MIVPVRPVKVEVRSGRAKQFGVVGPLKAGQAVGEAPRPDRKIPGEVRIVSRIIVMIVSASAKVNASMKSRVASLM